MKPTHPTREFSPLITLLLAGLALSSPASADSALLSVFAYASVTPISTHLYSLGGTGATSLNFDTALPSTDLMSSQGSVVMQTGNWLYGHTYNTDGELVSYFKEPYTEISHYKAFNTPFTLSARTIAVFETTAATGGNFQTCFSFGCQFDRNGPESARAGGWASMDVVGVGYYGTASQSATAAQEAYITVADQSSLSNGGCGNCTSSTGTGTENGVFTSIDAVYGPALSGAYSFTRGVLSVAFLNLTDSSMTGELSFRVGDYSRTTAEGVMVAVPEPETYALMLAGLGLVGFAARRRKPMNPCRKPGCF